MDNKIFVIYVAIEEHDEMPVHFERQAQIKAKAQIWTKAQNRV